MSERRVLSSWKEIADYLGVSVRTAQHWERDKGLPVRRLPGEKGRVAAYPEELDRWRDSNLTVESPARSALRIPKLLAGVGLTLALAAGAAYLLLSRKGPPANFRHDGRTLVVTDEQGRQLWRTTFPDAFHAQATPEELLRLKLAWFVDLDGDGRVELLYSYCPATREAKGDTLICFSDTGREKWRFVPGRALSTRSMEFPRTYRLLRLLPLLRRRDGTRNLAVVSANIPLYPSQVAVLSCRGEVRGEYWHSGHLGHIEMAELDGDGKPELLVAGISNGYASATLLVLDPENLAGASAEENPDYQLLGLGPGREKARLLVPRTCINRKFFPYGVPAFLGVTGTSIRMQVAEKVDSAFDSTVHYIFDRKLELKDVIPSDGFRILHREMEVAGQLDHPLSDAEIAELHKIRYLKRLGQ